MSGEWFCPGGWTAPLSTVSGGNRWSEDSRARGAGLASEEKVSGAHEAPSGQRRADPVLKPPDPVLLSPSSACPGPQLPSGDPSSAGGKGGEGDHLPSGGPAGGEGSGSPHSHPTPAASWPGLSEFPSMKGRRARQRRSRFAAKEPELLRFRDWPQPCVCVALARAGRCWRSCGVILGCFRQGCVQGLPGGGGLSSPSCGSASCGQNAVGGLSPWSPRGPLGKD